MAKKERIELDKKEWVSRFNIVGEAEVKDFTFSLDQKSEKSDYIYSRMNLSIDCGEKYGKPNVELMGGYFSEKDGVIYVHGKNEDGSDDFKNQYTIAFEDRFDEDILEDIGDMCFMTVGLEKTDKDKIFYKKFLSAYDMIAYINEHLENGMKVRVTGNMRYTVYNGNIQCKKEVNYITLVDEKPENYHANFTQTMLIDEDSCTKESLDKDKSILTVDAYILEKFKEYNGWDLTENGKIKGGKFVPLRKTFEFSVDLTTDAGKKKIQAVLASDKMFKVKKGTVTQITFDGEFIEAGAAVMPTIDDVPDDIKELIEMGIYTEEEALKACANNGARERRMLILKPNIKKVGDGDDKVTQLAIIPEKYSAEDLIFDFLSPKDEDDDEELPFDNDEEVVEESSDDDSDWLNAL